MFSGYQIEAITYTIVNHVWILALVLWSLHFAAKGLTTPRKGRK